MHVTRLSGLALFLLVSGVAQAQQIPTSLAMVALSPLVVVVLATVLGIVIRSWSVGILHVGLLVTWVIIFLFLVQHFDSDYKIYIISIPIIVYAIHTFLILVLLIVHIAKRFAAHNPSA